MVLHVIRQPDVMVLHVIRQADVTKTDAESLTSWSDLHVDSLMSECYDVLSITVHVL